MFFVSFFFVLQEKRKTVAFLIDKQLLILLYTIALTIVNCKILQYIIIKYSKQQNVVVLIYYSIVNAIDSHSITFFLFTIVNTTKFYCLLYLIIIYYSIIQFTIVSAQYSIQQLFVYYTTKCYSFAVLNILQYTTVYYSKGYSLPQNKKLFIYYR